MKFLLTLAMCCQILNTLEAQPSTNNKLFYDLQARKNKTIAWITIGGGAALVGSAFILSATNDYNPERFETPNRSKRSVATIMFLTGAGSMLISVPFFVAASYNKGKSASAFFQLEERSTIHYRSIINKNYPALTVRISL